MDENGHDEPQAGPDNDLGSSLRVRMGRPRTMATIILVGIAFVLLLLVLSYLEDARYTIEIERVSSTEEERKAIEVTESLLTTILLDSPRYDFWSDGPSNTAPDDLNIYVYPRVIDSEAIDYYQWRVDAQRKLVSDDRAEMEYSARGTYFSNLTLFVDISFDTYSLGTWDRTIGYHGEDLFMSPFLEVDNEGNLHLESGYLVFQRLEYREHYGGLAAYGGTVEQFTVLDDDHKVLLICIEREGWIA